VAELELPHEVVDRTAPYVKTVHIKGFAFTRQAGWVGFTLAGCPLGGRAGGGAIPHLSDEYPHNQSVYL
jgi:hypothetical protein